MRMLKLSICLSIVILLSQSSFAYDATCESRLEEAVNECVATLEKADSLHYGLRAEINTNQAIINDYKSQVDTLRIELNDYKAWYKQPSFVGTASAILTSLLIGFIVIK
jgi:uncharacterized protein YlxW (UPF0749 family)